MYFCSNYCLYEYIFELNSSLCCVVMLLLAVVVFFFVRFVVCLAFIRSVYCTLYILLARAHARAMCAHEPLGSLCWLLFFFRSFVRWFVQSVGRSFVSPLILWLSVLVCIWFWFRRELRTYYSIGLVYFSHMCVCANVWWQTQERERAPARFSRPQCVLPLLLLLLLW